MIFGTIEKWESEIEMFGGIAVGHSQKHENDITKNDIDNAVETGLIAFDTSPLYKNEKEVGLALSKYDNNFRIISKFPCVSIHEKMYGYDNVIKQFESSYLNLNITDYLIHWPVFPLSELKSTWSAFEFLKKTYNIKIGVCNFDVKHLHYLFDICEFPPEINQFEINIFLQNDPLVSLCKNHNIEMISYSSIARGRKTDVISNEIMLQWLMMQDITPIIRSSKLDRLKNLFNVPKVDVNLDAMRSYDEQYRLMIDPNILSPW